MSEKNKTLSVFEEGLSKKSFQSIKKMVKSDMIEGFIDMFILLVKMNQISMIAAKDVNAMIAFKSKAESYQNFLNMTLRKMLIEWRGEEEAKKILARVDKELTKVS